MGAKTEVRSVLADKPRALALAALLRTTISDAVQPHLPSANAGFATSPPNGMQFRAAILDVEDVLYDASDWYRWLAHLFASSELRPLQSTFDLRWHGELLPQVYLGQRSYGDAFVECLSGLGLATAHVEEIVAAARAQLRAGVPVRRTFPGVRTALAQLRAAGIRLGLLANLNRPGRAVLDDLATLRLDGLFESATTSLDLGCCLPDVRAYRHALATLGVAPGEALFVSHDVRELVGATAAGMCGAAFNAAGCPENCRRIARFEELLGCFGLIVPEMHAAA